MLFLEYGLSIGIFVTVLFAGIYITIQFIKIRKRNKSNLEMLYFKEPDFDKAKNKGDDPCDVKVPFGLPDFSQDCDYFI